MTPWRDGVETNSHPTLGTCVEVDTFTVVSMVVQLLQLRDCGCSHEW